METKECILCGNIDIQTENNYDKITVICKSCEAQYSISEKEKSIIKYPKYNLNPKYIANGFMIVRGLILFF
jgi:DNA-directed RNA polymerase subunit M/transcription elongation factor TFIIS